MKTVPYDVTNANDLRLGDIVAVAIDAKSAYSHCTVLAIHDKGVKLLRPYVATTDFSYGADHGGSQLIGYLGFEEFTIQRTTSVTVLQESSVPEITNTETDPDRLERSGVAQRRRDGTDNPVYRRHWKEAV